MNHIELLIKYGICHFTDIKFCYKVTMPVLDIKPLYHIEKCSIISDMYKIR